VRDHNGQALSYIYYENDPDRRSAAKLMTKDEARRIAANLPASLSGAKAAVVSDKRLNDVHE
jgi:hypothetical protein